MKLQQHFGSYAFCGCLRQKYSKWKTITYYTSKVLSTDVLYIGTSSHSLEGLLRFSKLELLFACWYSYVIYTFLFLCLLWSLRFSINNGDMKLGQY